MTLIFAHARGQEANSLTEVNQLTDRCRALYQARKYDEAVEVCQRVVEIREKSFSSDCPPLVSALNFLGSVYKAKGEYARAESQFQLAAATAEKGLGSEHLYVSNSLNELGLLYWSKGEYDKAELVYQRALAIREKALGVEHPDVAVSLNNLATAYFAKGDYAKAEPLLLRALAIYEKKLGSEHPAIANSLDNLGLLYQMKGDYTKAEQDLQRALDIQEKALGGEHPNTAMSLYLLATLYFSKGDYAKAEPLYQRSLAIREKVFGGEHPDVAASVSGLGRLYEAKGDIQKAEQFFERALAIQEKVLGSGHPYVTPTLNHLAELYCLHGDYTKAEPLYLRALAITERVQGREHPYVAAVLDNLGSLYYAEGEYAKAEPFFLRAIAIDEKAFGNEHPHLALSLVSLAEVFTAKEDYVRAVETQMRAQEISERNINAILATGSETQKQLYLNTLLDETYKSVSLNAHSAPTNAQAARLALTTILRRKGRALDAMTDQIASLRRRAGPEDAKLLDALSTAQSQLATFKLSNDTRLSPDERRARVTQLETEIGKLQDDIGRRSTEFRARTQPTTLDAVRAAIPPEAALIEIFAYWPHDTKVKSYFSRYGEERYVAYILKSTDETPQFVDLGGVKEIDAELKLWRAALLDPARTDVRELGRKVYERVMRPIRKLLGTTKRIFISPDGALNLIPFAALVDENDKYLIETYSLDYLTSGRDLLRLQVRGENRSGAVVFANPTYNLTGERVAACGGGVEDLRGGLALRATSFSGIDFSKVCYRSLKGTAEEATLINAVLKTATVLTEKQATEAALKTQSTPAILHIATHGFFLTDQTQAASNTRQLDRVEIDGNSSIPTAQTENPLLRSGLIMAGANQKSSGAGEDGVLTAAEVAGLNLWGTKLVVLSACETGLGDVVNGAGVYGLRRALVLAGSETQVMSLWQVDDEATRDLMSDYYARLQRGEGRTEAMRLAQLKILRGKSHDRAHPFYWAAFISSGDWRSMN